MSLPLIALAILETARISVPTVWESMTGRFEPETGTRRLRSWSRRLLEHAHVDLRVRGKDSIALGQSYIIMSNHGSLYDIPILFEALPLDFRMVAKAELFRVPIWGRAMREAGFVAIDRARGREARAILSEKGRSLRSAGLSLWIAPEGTRSPSDELLPFRSGGFDLAIGLGLPILPVRIDGARDILSKKSAAIRRGVGVSVQIFPPLMPNGEGDRDTVVRSLKTRVFDLLQTRSV